MAERSLSRGIGYGKQTTGGEGGRVYEVTETSDGWHPGTLRHAAEQPGPKVIDVRAPAVYLAESLLTDRKAASRTTWQLNGAEVWGNVWPAAYGVEPVSDIIIRDGRFLGPSTLGPMTIKDSTGDSLTGYRIDRLYIENCTFAGGVDECLGLQHCGNLTVRRCIITEAAMPGDGGQQHVEGNHNYGGMASNITGGVSWIECLFANCRNRMPAVDGPHPAEIVNCFSYNFEKMSSETCRVAELTVEGSVWKAGPNSRGGTAIGIHQILRDGPAKPVAIVDCAYEREGEVITDPAEIHRLGMPGLTNGFVETPYGPTRAIVSASVLLSHLRTNCGPQGVARLAVEDRAFIDAESRRGAYGVRYNLPKVPGPLPPRPPDDDPTPPVPPPPPLPPATGRKWKYSGTIEEVLP